MNDKDFSRLVLLEDEVLTLVDRLEEFFIEWLLAAVAKIVEVGNAVGNVFLLRAGCGLFGAFLVAGPGTNPAVIDDSKSVGLLSDNF